MHTRSLLMKRFRRSKSLLSVVVAAAMVAALSFGLFTAHAMAGDLADEREPVAFEDIPDELSEEAAAWIKSSKVSQGIYRFDEGDKTYIMVAWGEKSSGGYSVDINDAGRNYEGIIVLGVDLQAPDPDDQVIQAITHPYDVIAVEKTDALVAAEFSGASWLPDDADGLPMVSTEIFAETPRPGGILGETAVIRAAARLFEGTYRVIIEDGHDQLLTYVGTASAGGPEWGAIELDLPYETPTSPYGLVIFSWQDMQDSEDEDDDLWRDELAIPVKFEHYERPDVVLTDIEGHWAEGAIWEAVQQGFINGYPDETFKPDNDVTRAEFLKMVMAALKMEPAAADETPFADTADHWARGYIDEGASLGILKVSDYEDGMYEPDTPISRLEMAQYVVRALGAEDTAALHADKAGRFSDAAGLSDDEKGYIGAAVNLNIIEGYEDGTVRAHRTATRAEAVTVVQRTVLAAHETF